MEVSYLLEELSVVITSRKVVSLLSDAVWLDPDCVWVSVAMMWTVSGYGAQRVSQTMIKVNTNLVKLNCYVWDLLVEVSDTYWHGFRNIDY